jgi:hypothetical protein
MIWRWSGTAPAPLPHNWLPCASKLRHFWNKMGRVCNRNAVKETLTDLDGFTCMVFCSQLKSVIARTSFGAVPIGDSRVHDRTTCLLRSEIFSISSCNSPILCILRV